MYKYLGHKKYSVKYKVQGYHYKETFTYVNKHKIKRKVLTTPDNRFLTRHYHVKLKRNLPHENSFPCSRFPFFIFLLVHLIRIKCFKITPPANHPQISLPDSKIDDHQRCILSKYLVSNPHHSSSISLSWFGV